ncbi:Uncharacterised protein [Acidipropionibacterium jensenii]|uniref:Uncharacterized protein n=1 Tax=Acidipropionibacterium jensenii TaxID=1749 RepID=A0A3S5EV89_9ACTN|nr:hypothetical protein [Acidipropionibacterium jensenii]VEI03499.1 Uncharacterised protein [Acidipropionibacterium jensenii]
MWAHGIRAIPWRLVLASSGLLIALVMLVEYNSWLLWPLQGIAVGLLTAAVCWCLDEPLAGVVDAAPRGILWRTTARLVGVLPLLGVWLVMVWGTARRCAGSATPGHHWAALVVPAVTAWAIVRPAQMRVPVFPYATHGVGGSWTSSTVGWSILGATALVLLAGLLVTDGRLPRPGRSSGAGGSSGADRRSGPGGSPNVAQALRWDADPRSAQ